jgi:hypothetical protein
MSCPSSQEGETIAIPEFLRNLIVECLAHIKESGEPFRQYDGDDFFINSIPVEFIERFIRALTYTDEYMRGCVRLAHQEGCADKANQFDDLRIIVDVVRGRVEIQVGSCTCVCRSTTKQLGYVLK